MIGHIYIEGQIGSSHKEDGTVDVRGVELQDVISQVRKNAHAETIICHITSPGGYVDVGQKIAAYCASIPNLIMLAEVQCASIATEIHLSVPVERRQIAQGTAYLIHQPMASLQRGVNLNKDELAMLSSDTAKIESEMVSMYAKATGLGKVELELLMQQNEPLTADQCKEFGFVSEIITTPIQAVALLTPKKDNDMSKMTEEIKALRLQIAQFIAPKGKTISLKVEKIALDLTTEDGVDVVVTNAEGDPSIDVPMIGDLIAMPDGSAMEDATYQFPQGQLVVVGGVITDVLAPAGEEVDAEALALENATLKAENEEAKIALEALKADFTAMAKLQSTYKPKVLQVAFKKVNEAPTQEDSYNAIKEARKAKLAK